MYGMKGEELDAEGKELIRYWGNGGHKAVGGEVWTVRTKCR